MWLDATNEGNLVGKKDPFVILACHLWKNCSEINSNEP